MGVDVHALGDRLDGFTNRTAIFDNGFVLGHVAHGDFVAEGDVIEKFDFPGGFAFQRDNAGSGAFLQIHDGHADIIAWLV